MNDFYYSDVNDFSLPKVIKKRILSDILEGNLKIGDKILEQHYAKIMNVSRAPVREAISMLAAEGFVEKIPRKGSIVQTYSKEEILDLSNLRFYLELEAVVKLRNIDDLGKLIENLTELNRLIRENKCTPQASHYNHKFHHQIVLASGSKVINNAYPKNYLYLLALELQGYERDHTNYYIALKDHDTIIESLKERNFDNVTETLKKHKLDFLSLLNDYIKKTIPGKSGLYEHKD